MRTSQYLISTLKETPSDATVISHQLMLRAGMIRKIASGLYTWLPMGLRVLRKVERVVREEMDRAGAQEVLMPVVQPMELWEESGRAPAYGPELLRFTFPGKQGSYLHAIAVFGITFTSAEDSIKSTAVDLAKWGHFKPA